MKNNIFRVRQLFQSIKLPKWARVVLRIVLVTFFFMVVAYVSLAWYINTHKQQVLQQVTATLNQDLKGGLTIGNMETTFLQGFPRVSLRLQNVVLRDSLHSTHKYTLLKAGHIDLAVNALAFMRGSIQIKSITISNASVYLYTDVNGYSNTSIFRKKNKQSAEKGSATFPELNRIKLDNVKLSIDDRKKQKLYNFAVEELRATMREKVDGWKYDVKLNVLVQSMAFSTRKGSFIKDKYVQGKLDIIYSKAAGLIVFEKNRLEIGGEDFTVGAKFNINKPSADFDINIANKSILWKNAAGLLSPNITRKLMMFNLKNPIAVKCNIAGNFGVQGDPSIMVNAQVDNNELDTPGGVVKDCSFFGVFTNEHNKGRGYNDANSAIKLFNFKGKYADIPVSMKKTFILNLEQPLAVGDFKSDFKVEKLNNLIDDDLLKFTDGEAAVALNYKADIVDFKLSKPLVSGIVSIKDAGVAYIPRKLDFRDISVKLNFTEEDLYISRINLKSGGSIVNMDGSIRNFLNLYYTAPEKIVLNWNIHSPQLNLSEFMGFLGSRNKKASKSKPKQKGNFTDEVNLLFEKSNVDIKLRVDKIIYNKFTATDAKADILLTEAGIKINNAGLKHAGGLLKLTGFMAQTGKVNNYNLNARVSNVDVKKFFGAFSNFGLESLNENNLKGYLSSKVNVAGAITDAGAIVPKSIYGDVSFTLKKGALLNFEPVRNIGRFAFPFRNMDTITFANLNGKFNIKGEKVTIHPMQVNSSVLNMDVAGIYSFGKGTNIKVDVPLRNPERDKKITDDKELAKRRNRGIVLHLVAADDKDGKVKIKLGKGK